MFQYIKTRLYSWKHKLITAIRAINSSIYNFFFGTINTATTSQKNPEKTLSFEEIKSRVHETLSKHINALGTEDNPNAIADHLQAIEALFKRIISEHDEATLVTILNGKLDPSLQERLLAKTTIDDHYSSMVDPDKYLYLLDIAANNSRRQAAEKLLLQYGATAIQKLYLSPMIGALILAPITSKLGNSFNPTILTTGNNRDRWPPLLDKFKMYVTNIISKMLQVPNGSNFLPIYKSFIIASDQHWSSLIIQFSMKNINPCIKFFILDSAAGGAGPVQMDLITAVSDIFKSNRLNTRNIQVYVSHVYLQHDNKSCKAISLTATRMLHSLLYGKFSADYDLFEELAKMQSSGQYVKNGIKFIKINNLPAKLLNISQDPDDEIVKAQSNEKVNSKGCLLWMSEGNKIDLKFEKFIANIEIDKLPIPERPKYLQDNVNKFAVLN